MLSECICVVVGVGRWPYEGLRRRAGPLGDCGAASIMVASEDEVLLEEERERNGVELREAMLSYYVQCSYTEARDEGWYVASLVGR